MNTSTIEQVEELEKLGVEILSSNFAWFDGPYNMPTLLYCGKNSSPIVWKYLEIAITLDDLHRVFEFIDIWPKCSKFLSHVWRVANLTDMSKTKNHAEDWANILIWLLKEGLVTAKEVNEAL